MQWFDRAWKNRKSIPIPSSKIEGGEPLKDFPYKVATQRDFDLARSAQRNGADIIFTLSDGITRLDHEIQHWDPDTGRLIAFVKIPILRPGKDTFIFIYYGNPKAPLPAKKPNVWSAYRFRKAFIKDSFSLLGNSQESSRGKSISNELVHFFNAQLRLHEELFCSQWLKQNAVRGNRHPAVLRWQLCKRMIETKGRLSLPRDNPQLPALANTILDASSLVECTKGDIMSFSLGDLANYGDEAVQRRIRSVIKHPSQYLDLLTELHFAAWHFARGHKVIAYEDPGFPDHSIIIPSWRLPLVADSKRLQSSSSLNRVHDVVKKADKQIKQFKKACYGMAVLDLSEKLNNPRPLTDSFPQELIEVRNVVNNTIRDYYSAVSAVLLVWNEYSVLPPAGKGSVLMVILRRRSHILHHKLPRYRIEEQLDDTMVYWHVSFTVRMLT